MWIWLILKNISLLYRIWRLWLVRFVHSPTNFIFWLGRRIFSVSINSHLDNIYIFGDYYNWTRLFAILFRPFGYLLPKTKLFIFPIFLFRAFLIIITKLSLLSLGPYLCWWCISLQGYHSPSSQYFGTDIGMYILLKFTVPK